MTPIFAALAPVASAKQVGHDFDVFITGVIQAGQIESTLHGFKQRKVGIELAARASARPIIRVHDRQHLVDIRSEAVVVLVPYYDNSTATRFPRGRTVDRMHNVPQRDIPEVDQGGVKPGLGTVVVRIEVALRAGIGASVLVIALVGHDERATESTFDCRTSLSEPPTQRE